MRRRKVYPTLIVYVSDEERAVWQSEAKKQGMPVSVWVKHVVRARLNTKVRFRESGETPIWAGDGQSAEETPTQTEEKQVD